MSEAVALANLEVVTGAFLADLGATDPSASCADIRWTAAQLAAHLGGVHRWAAGNAREGKRGERANVPEITVSPIEWYSTSRDVLLETLRELDPDARCYTLSATDKSVRFWHRRQLFESLVHLWDLRSATDPAAAPPAEVAPNVHADGVSELFDVFLPRSSELERTPLGGGIELVATDTGDRWVFGPEWQRNPGLDTVATVRASAGELLLWVWNRGSARAAVEFEGDSTVIRRFEKAHVRP
jgi:uncharacterized protein (TIGR03083 family)